VQRAIDDVLEKITLKDLLVPESEMNAWPVFKAGSAGLPTIAP
jgi:hypothetical protein